MTKLQPCPFCGSEPVLDYRKGVTGKACKTRYWRGTVRCKNRQCQAACRERNNPEQAVKDWNNRSVQENNEASND